MIFGEFHAIGGLIVNRLLPSFGPGPDRWSGWRDAAAARPPEDGGLADVLGVVGQMAAASAAERSIVAPLVERAGVAPVAEVPVLAREVADVAALA